MLAKIKTSQISPDLQYSITVVRARAHLSGELIVLLFDLLQLLLHLRHLLLVVRLDVVQHLLQQALLISSILRRNQNHVSVGDVNPLPVKLSYYNFHPLEVVGRCRDPQLQVAENYWYSFSLRPNICKS